MNMKNMAAMALSALLCLTVSGARADWTGGTYTATATENLGAITVSADATLTINEGVTVTVTGGINVASGTLTVTGPGTLEVTGANGTDGWYDDENEVLHSAGNGGAAISGNIIVQGGATVTATGGNGGKGGDGDFFGGKGGNGGNAFAGTLTYKSGTVIANGGSGGSGGWGEKASGNGGSAGNAFANDVDFTQTTGYSVTDGTSTITTISNQKTVVISGGIPNSTVTLKSGTEDATSWQGKAGTGEYQALPLEGVAAGTAVSVKYNGTKKVKSVNAKKAAPALNLTSPAVGQVIGKDGKNYDYASLPGGVTAVAKICYVSGSNGLALALTDEGKMNWWTAMSTCAAHTPAFTNGTWKLATRDEWMNMINTAGGYEALRDGFSSIGGTNMQSGEYWSSTESDYGIAWYGKFYNGYWDAWRMSTDYWVRASLLF